LIRLPRFPKIPHSLLALALSAWLVACAGMPVQQQSDARQAIKAAQKADAAKYAPDLLAEAQAHLKTGETNLRSGEYRTARDEFEVAREKAMEARRIAEAAAPPRSRP
jgi:hypothetical protein